MGTEREREGGVGTRDYAFCPVIPSLYRDHKENKDLLVQVESRDPMGTEVPRVLKVTMDYLDQM